MRTKAERRHLKETRKAAARRMVRHKWSSFDYTEADIQGLAHQMACNCDNLKMCNGACCKNPRRSGWLKAGGKTHRELLVERIAKGKCE